MTENIFRFYRKKIRNPITGEMSYHFDGLAGWHSILPENMRYGTAHDMVMIAGPLLGQRLSMVIPEVEFQMRPIWRWVSPWRIAEGSPPGCRHWKIYVPNLEVLNKVRNNQHLIWDKPYGLFGKG